MIPQRSPKTYDTMWLVYRVVDVPIIGTAIEEHGVWRTETDALAAVQAQPELALSTHAVKVHRYAPSPPGMAKLRRQQRAKVLNPPR